MSDNTSYVLLSEIRDLLRQSVELQKQTLAEVRVQVELEKSVVNPIGDRTVELMDLFADLYSEARSVPQDNDNCEKEEEN